MNENETRIFPPIRELHRRLVAREISPVELVQTCLERIERLEAQVHAWVVVDADGARRQAQELGRELAIGRGAPGGYPLVGAGRGPLHGIPIAIKDIVDVQGFPTKAGSPILRDVAPAEYDATIVARLRAAGAIILGKTVTTEFASFDPPPTRNPWNLDRTPGGSSSGSAAATALGMCVAAIGSQTGGSITRPASFCRIAGCKPTHGLVSLKGILPLSPPMDHPGPMARCVDDLNVLLDVIAGYDGSDPWSAEYLLRPSGDQREFTITQPPRIGVLEDFLKAAHPSVASSFSLSLDKLAAARATIVRKQMPPTFVDVYRNHRLLMAADAAQCHRAMFPSRRGEFGPHIAKLLDEGLRATATEYSAALAHRQQFKRDMQLSFDDLDALVLPATVTTAPMRETTGDPKFNSPWSYSGLPTVSVPSGLGEDGLPVSIQLVGRAFTEAHLLSAAAWCEKVLDFHCVPPSSLAVA